MTTRRNFLGILGIGAGAALAGPAVAKVVVAASAFPAAPAVSVAELSAIDADLGPITAGRIMSSDGSCVIDFGRGSIQLIEADRFVVRDVADRVILDSPASPGEFA